MFAFRNRISHFVYCLYIVLGIRVQCREISHCLEDSAQS